MNSIARLIAHAWIDDSLDCRGLTLATLCRLNAVLWISFAAIDKETGVYFGVSVEAVNWLAIIFQVLYLPGTVFALYLLSATSLRRALLLGASMGLVSAAIRLLSSFFVGASYPSYTAYSICFVAQIIGATKQIL